MTKFRRYLQAVELLVGDAVNPKCVSHALHQYILYTSVRRLVLLNKTPYRVDFDVVINVLCLYGHE